MPETTSVATIVRERDGLKSRSKKNALLSQVAGRLPFGSMLLNERNGGKVSLLQ
jgi:hypothetical protein